MFAGQDDGATGGTGFIENYIVDDSGLTRANGSRGTIGSIDRKIECEREKMIMRLGKRQAEVLLACVKGDDLLGADYPKQRRQRMALVAKGLIVIGAKARDGYVPTPAGIMAAQDLIEMGK